MPSRPCRHDNTRRCEACAFKAAVRDVGTADERAQRLALWRFDQRLPIPRVAA